ncbi:MAG: Fe-S cluster assembly protein SufB, partial [Chloroflexi bacterium]
MTTVNPSARDAVGEYKWGFHDDEKPLFMAEKGLNEDVIRGMSAMKGEPAWMLENRLDAYHQFLEMKNPSWTGSPEILNAINFDDIHYYVRATDTDSTSWDDVPAYIKDTFDKLGIPEAERQFLAGAGAQYDSEVVYHNIREDLAKQGVLFLGMDQALAEHPEIVQEYFGTIIPSGDNRFAALNTAVWSGGSFIYVPKGVKVDIPLQAYFRINTENMGQFERTLIIADEGSQVHYVEGCTAPTYSTASLHSAVVEIIVKKNARVRYSTIQNWSNNVYNLVTKRAYAYENAIME